MAARRYAEGTKVDVESSQGQIKKLLMANGADQFMMAEADSDEGTASFVQFRMNRRMVRYDRIYPNWDDYKISEGGRHRSESQIETALAAEWRRMRRALHLIIKAKIEMVSSGDTTFEREFLADIMLPKGGTVGEVLLPQLSESYASGKMPNLLTVGR